MSSSRVVLSFRRVELPSRMSFRRVECLFVELNVFSSSRVVESNVFCPSRMSLRRVGMSFRRSTVPIR